MSVRGMRAIGLVLVALTILSGAGAVIMRDGSLGFACALGYLECWLCAATLPTAPIAPLLSEER